MSGLPPGTRAGRAPYGIGLVLLAFGLFSIVDASAKWLVVYGYSALQPAFMRYAGHFLIAKPPVGHDYTLNCETDGFYDQLTGNSFLLCTATTATTATTVSTGCTLLARPDPR